METFTTGEEEDVTISFILRQIQKIVNISSSNFKLFTDLAKGEEEEKCLKVLCVE